VQLTFVNRLYLPMNVDRDGKLSKFKFPVKKLLLTSMKLSFEGHGELSLGAKFRSQAQLVIASWNRFWKFGVTSNVSISELVIAHRLRFKD